MQNVEKSRGQFILARPHLHSCLVKNRTH